MRIVLGDKTIWWRTPVLAAANMIPIVGSFVTLGYMMVLMRKAAWSSEEGLPAFSPFGELLRRGVDGIVVSLLWALVTLPVFIVAIGGWVAFNFTSLASNPPPPPAWLTLAIVIPVALFTPLMYASILRSSVYLTAVAGLSFAGVRGMIAKDSGGFKKVASLALWVALLGVVLGQFLVLTASALALPTSVGSMASTVGGFFIGLLTIPLTLIVAAAYGLWANDTDPATWPPQHAATEQPAVVIEPQ